MNPVPAGLENLRGLHLPAGSAGAVQGEIALAVALGFLAALAVGLVRWWRRRAKASLRRRALAELAAVRHLAPEARLVAQARLLRRIVRTVEGDAAADARGAEWSARLDRVFATTFFTRGAGRVLGEGLYRRESADPAAIDAELGRLFAQIKA
ncbi:hypothetical protein ASG40_09195 [Methylobacterium sp. Leaf399]|uniref:DUF4381 domain-containing protein n=1 Tax=unclassified Methylobacterium TaxID=2615210 RepID=UPI0006F7A591|nr:MULTISPECIES: DUF4381 domain-containing protein [unclassified Methylobacterium]KQP55163.1 hypothetical protein ASF39_05435 [Methylobacterium sp. Leaf108]KQT09902.1 hypothetical protein ASG40_09195 [Methylobacterium sp. Leaf399]KQT77864.1 hypothetical protein ASG59_11110 [Methylobacterium sp. Leaf466]